MHQSGYDRDRLLTMTPLHVMPEFTEQQLRELLDAVAAAAEPREVATLWRDADGTDIPVEILLEPP